MKIKRVNEFFDIDNMNDNETIFTSKERYKHFSEQLDFIIKSALTHLDPDEVKHALQEVSKNIEV